MSLSNNSTFFIIFWRLWLNYAVFIVHHTIDICIVWKKKNVHSINPIRVQSNGITLIETNISQTPVHLISMWRLNRLSSYKFLIWVNPISGISPDWLTVRDQFTKLGLLWQYRFCSKFAPTVHCLLSVDSRRCTRVTRFHNQSLKSSF